VARCLAAAEAAALHYRDRRGFLLCKFPARRRTPWNIGVAIRQRSSRDACEASIIPRSICTAMTSGVPPRNIFIAKRATKRALSRHDVARVRPIRRRAALRGYSSAVVSVPAVRVFQRVGELDLDIRIASNDPGQPRFFAMP
jgi:hypothetical protein